MFTMEVPVFIDRKMNAVFVLFLKNCPNQPLTVGHFVVIDNESEDLPWRRHESDARVCFFNEEVSIRSRFSLVVGRIQG